MYFVRCFGHLSKQLTHWERPAAGEDRRQKEKRAAEDEVAGWRHRFNGHELGQTLGGREGQGGLACCSPWVTESGVTSN